MYKRFSGHKTYHQIKAQCKRDGVAFGHAAYKNGYDMVYLRSPGVLVAYDTTTGCFYGTVPDYGDFSSADKLDGRPWFDALLAYFYVE